MAESIYQELKAAISEQGPAGALQRLSEALAAEKRYHELFDVRLMQARHALGLEIVASTSIDELGEPTRSQLEEKYLEACREVGSALLAEGKLREAWMYLRPVGDKAPVAAALEDLRVGDDQVEEVVEIAVHEGVSPRRGFEVVLDQYGICNAITMFEGSMHERPKSDRQQVVALLVRNLYNELFENVKADVERQAGSPPQESTLGELVAERDWIFQEDAYHVDTSHLHSVVRFARVVDDPEVLRLAAELTEYGNRLGSQYQYQTEEPFAETYPAHRLFFRALLGEDVDEALAYFQQKARDLPAEQHGTGPAEVYIALLSRLGRHGEALEAAAELLPPGAQHLGFAPSLLELARASGNYDRLLEICQGRDDLLGFATSLVEGELKGDKQVSP